MNSLIQTVEEENTVDTLSQQIGAIYLRRKFYSEEDASEFHILIGASGIIAYSEIGKNKTLLWSKKNEMNIGQIFMVNSLGYCVGNKGIAWMDLDTGDVHMKVLFEDLGMGMITKIDTISNIGFGSGGVFKFRRERRLTGKIMGDTLVSRLHSEVESGMIEWRYSGEKLQVGAIKVVYPTIGGAVILGEIGICIIGNDGKLLFSKNYSEIGIEEIVQVYENGWIIGKDKALQMDYHTGELIAGAHAMNIEQFIAFSAKNKYSLMKEPKWDNIPGDQAPVDTIESMVSRQIAQITG